MRQNDSTTAPARFTPLHNSGEFDCLLGYRSDACATELYDEAMRRQRAVLGLLDALNGTPNLDELSSEPLNGCLQAIKILCGDGAALYAAAWERVQPGPVDETPSYFSAAALVDSSDS